MGDNYIMRFKVKSQSDFLFQDTDGGGLHLQHAWSSFQTVDNLVEPFRQFQLPGSLYGDGGLFPVSFEESQTSEPLPHA